MASEIEQSKIHDDDSDCSSGHNDEDDVKN
jgi:hypothetical protein